MTDNTKMQENLRKLAELAKCEVAQVGDKLFYSAALPCDAGTVRPLPTSPDTMDTETVLSWLVKAGYWVEIHPTLLTAPIEVDIFSVATKKIASAELGSSLPEALGKAIAALELEKK